MQKVEWKDFIAQHDGLQLLKERYDLTDEDIEEAFVQGLNSLLQTKNLVTELGGN